MSKVHIPLYERNVVEMSESQRKAHFNASTLCVFVENAVLNKIGLKGPTEKAILSAMREWEKKTCIKFKPRTTERDYIEFIDSGFGKYVFIAYYFHIDFHVL